MPKVIKPEGQINNHYWILTNRPFGPEFIDNFEIGLKTIKDYLRFINHRFLWFQAGSASFCLKSARVGEPKQFLFFHS